MVALAQPLQEAELDRAVAPGWRPCLCVSIFVVLQSPWGTLYHYKWTCIYCFRISSFGSQGLQVSFVYVKSLLLSYYFTSTLDSNNEHANIEWQLLCLLPCHADTFRVIPVPWWENLTNISVKAGNIGLKKKAHIPLQVTVFLYKTEKRQVGI